MKNLWKRIVAALSLAALLVVGAALPASAATADNITTTCESLSINLSGYPEGEPFIPGTTKKVYTQYQWWLISPKKPNVAAPGAGWVANSAVYAGQVVEKSYKVGQDWFYWDVTTVQIPKSAGTYNFATIYIDGFERETIAFKQTLDRVFWYNETGYEHTYSVVIDSLDSDVNVQYDGQTEGCGWSQFP